MIAVFGDKTAEAAANAGLKVYAKAPAPGTPSMAKAIELLVQAAKSGKELEPLEIGASHVAEDFIKAQEAKPVKKVRAKRKPTTTAATKA